MLDMPWESLLPVIHDGCITVSPAALCCIGVRVFGGGVVVGSALATTQHIPTRRGKAILWILVMSALDDCSWCTDRQQWLLQVCVWGVCCRSLGIAKVRGRRASVINVDTPQSCMSCFLISLCVCVFSCCQ